MTLANGVRLGPYEILSPVGAGGMGEVYRFLLIQPAAGLASSPITVVANWTASVVSSNSNAASSA